MSNQAVDLAAVSAIFQRTDGAGTFDLKFFVSQKGLCEPLLRIKAQAALVASAETVLADNEDASDYTLVRVAYDWPNDAVLVP